MNKPIFYQCIVLDNKDPLMLGRVRGRLVTDNNLDVLKSITNPPWNEERDKWTQRDPLIFNPLLPYYIYQVPREKEMIQIIYVNNDFRYKNQYYVQNTFFPYRNKIHVQSRGKQVYWSWSTNWTS